MITSPFLPHKVQQAYEQCVEQLRFEEPSFSEAREQDGTGEQPALLTRHLYSLIESEDCWTVFETHIYNDEHIGKVEATSPRYTISIDESFNAQIEEIL